MPEVRGSAVLRPSDVHQSLFFVTLLVHLNVSDSFVHLKIKKVFNSYIKKGYLYKLRAINIRSLAELYTTSLQTRWQSAQKYLI